MAKKNAKAKKVSCDCGCDCCSDNSKCRCKWHKQGCGECLYGLGVIGAAIYYISLANGFWMGVLGFLKALVWPAFLVYNLLKSLGM